MPLSNSENSQKETIRLVNHLMNDVFLFTYLRGSKEGASN